MELSKEFWGIKKRNGTPKITWKIISIYVILTIETVSLPFYDKVRNMKLLHTEETTFKTKELK